MSEVKPEKFFILVIKPNSDNMEFEEDHEPSKPYKTSAISHRSKSYPTYEVAVEKATQYIGEGRAKKYWVMEAVASVGHPVAVEVKKI